ncbi:MAG: type II toxin-antitoxin system RelE/ParE family toxin [Casimicrobium sp.]
MEVRFDDEKLSRLETDPTFTNGFDQSIVKAFRKRMQAIRAAPDERDFYAMKSLHFEKLVGDREGQNSMRLNDQWRLILRLEKTETGKIVVVISITDYH